MCIERNNMIDKQAKTNPPLGRPSEYTEEMGDHICNQLALGKPLTRILRENPTYGLKYYPPSSVYRWLDAHVTFREKYARAREDQADTNADEMLDIADETPEIKKVLDKDGNVLAITMDSSYLQWQKMRIEARKWNAMKLKPKKYGDKTTISGDAEAPIVVEQSFDIFAELLKNMKMLRQAE